MNRVAYSPHYAPIRHVLGKLHLAKSMLLKGSAESEHLECVLDFLTETDGISGMRKYQGLGVLMSMADLTAEIIRPSNSRNTLTNDDEYYRRHPHRGLLKLESPIVGIKLDPPTALACTISFLLGIERTENEPNIRSTRNDRAAVITAVGYTFGDKKTLDRLVKDIEAVDFGTDSHGSPQLTLPRLSASEPE